MENKTTPLKYYTDEVNNQIEKTLQAKKRVWSFKDSVIHQKYGTTRTKELIKAIRYIESKPLLDNDYYKFVNAYNNNKIKLNTKYFRHDLSKLEDYYSKVDENTLKGSTYNPFDIRSYESYVLFMCLKLTGHYENEDDEIFNVKTIDFREYNPLSSVPSVLRGNLPFEVKEYDIKRAFPTFIDIELDTDFRHSVYDEISKTGFAIYLNSNSTSKVTIDKARKGLEPIYKEHTNKIITDERYNQQGKAFKDFAKYEAEYIEKFVSNNSIDNYARLHDGVFVYKDVHCSNTKFDKVEFSIKESIKPKIENDTISFYSFDEVDKVITSPTMYSDFLKQEDFIRITTPDDKIMLLQNKNNVIEYFNHKTNMVSFLENEINEVVTDNVKDVIAKENLSVLSQSYTLLPFSELNYYKDDKTRFGLPFKNGFYYFDEVGKIEIKNKSYSDVSGFFTPHHTQKINFDYTDEVGDFECFIQRISIGVKEYDSNNSEQKTIVDSFNSMIGYLCHNYKKQQETPAIILTDEGANDSNRNGGRGKTLITQAISYVQKTMIKGANEFIPRYDFNYYDLDKSYNVYVLDDIEAGFKLDCLYTQVTGGINVQKKGSKAEMIEFKDSPKFLITSNWLIRYDEKNTSTNRRFYEYKVKPYYHKNYTPIQEFDKTMFEDWDAIEWNKFYSYIFRCVNYYLKSGVSKIAYDKTEDNFNAEFNNDVKLSEMERIVDVLFNVKRQSSFSATEFIEVYNHFENPQRFSGLFSIKNVKHSINTYLKNTEIYKNVTYKDRGRRWFKD